MKRYVSIRKQIVLLLVYEFNGLEQIKLASFVLNYNEREHPFANETAAKRLVEEWQKEGE